MNEEEKYLDKIAEIRQRISDLEMQMERAGISSKGDLINQIESERQNLWYYQKLYNELTTVKTPEEIKVFLYVLVSTKDNVRMNVSEKLFCFFEENRYHDTDHQQWRPFRDQFPIDELLRVVTERYNVSPVYLDGDISNSLWVNLDDEINDSVVVVDLFSINQQNKPIAQKFDTNKAGVLMPLCRTLYHELVKVAEGFRNEFKVLKAKTATHIPCECYYSEIASAEPFQRELLQLFRKKFPVRNQVNGNSAVRNINMGIR